MRSRLITVCHLWPGITPFNVWDLDLGMWLMFASAADRYDEDQRKAANNG